MYGVDQCGNDYKCPLWIIVVINTNVRRESAWQQIQMSVLDQRGNKYKCMTWISLVMNTNVRRGSSW